MGNEYSVKEKDYERIINDFRSIRFSCIRCGSKNIEVIDADSNLDRTNVHGIHSATPAKDIKLGFHVTGILFCRKCNHRFHVKISDQGIRNTNIYFDNSLQDTCLSRYIFKRRTSECVIYRNRGLTTTINKMGNCYEHKLQKNNHTYMA